MIYHDKVSEHQSNFKELLEATKKAVVEKLRYMETPTLLSGNDFELLTFEEICKCSIGTEFEGHLVHTSDREFPDIVANHHFGVEVKKTAKDAWVSIGNSILESSRVDDIDKIYIFFGKLGGRPDVMYRDYESCMRGIAVTHYPRYQIDMNLPEGKSIFDLMGVDYNTMQTAKSPAKYVRNYYKLQMTEGDALWWIDDDIENAPALSPVIKNFSTLDAEAKDIIKAELFILCPEIFSNSANKFKKVPAYLASKYGVVCANVRDIFTAGGRVTLLDADGNEFKAPQVVGELLRLAPLIEKLLSEQSIDELTNSWERRVGERGGARDEWLYELNKESINLALPDELSYFYERNLQKNDRYH